MATFKDRFPVKQETIRALAVCVFPIHVWSIYNIFNEIPAWAIHLDLWRLIGAISYTQVFALLESLLVWAGFLLIAVLLPAKLFRDRFVAQVTVTMLLGSILAVVYHTNGQALRMWSLRGLAFWLGLLFAVVVGLSMLIYRSPRLKGLLDKVAERLMVLSLIYIFVDVVGLLTILLRNLI